MLGSSTFSRSPQESEEWGKDMLPQPEEAGISRDEPDKFESGNDAEWVSRGNVRSENPLHVLMCFRYCIDVGESSDVQREGLVLFLFFRFLWYSQSDRESSIIGGIVFTQEVFRAFVFEVVADRIENKGVYGFRPFRFVRR
ncbi:MAG TPA: hypothetical protein PK765_04125 [bacterium]|nr:hypothetical protein [bacterium]